MNTAPDVFKVFKKELLLIQDKEIWNFVTDAFKTLCPDYFWYIPASVGGYHPLICRTRGGLVHHVKLAVAFANSLLDMEDQVEGLLHNQVIAGVLLHDMLKRGAEENELATWDTHRQANTNHGRYCADQILKKVHIASHDLSFFQPIICAVRLHMGRWTNDLTVAEKADLKDCDVTRLVHAADYCASRALHQYLAERVMDPTMEYLKND